MKVKCIYINMKVYVYKQERFLKKYCNLQKLSKDCKVRLNQWNKNSQDHEIVKMLKIIATILTSKRLWHV